MSILPTHWDPEEPPRLDLSFPVPRKGWNDIDQALVTYDSGWRKHACAVDRL